MTNAGEDGKGLRYREALNARIASSILVHFFQGSSCNGDISFTWLQLTRDFSTKQVKGNFLNFFVFQVRA